MGAVWDRAAEFITDNLGAILPVALFAFFFPFSIRGNFATAGANGPFGLVLVLDLVSVAFAILSLWGCLTVIAMSLDSGDGRNAGALAGRRLAPALLVWVSVLAALLLLVMPVPLLLTANGYDPAAVVQKQILIAPALAWAIDLYLLALGALFLWISARLILVSPVIVQEKRLFGALARSFRLTRGLTLQIVGVMLLYFAVSMVAIWATHMVFGSIFQLIAGQMTGVSLSGVLTSVMVAAVQTACLLIVPAFTSKLYQALTIQRNRA
ncbi:MAG: hypothetical protein WDN44_14955 [Sphingomonas sp.]